MEIKQKINLHNKFDIEVKNIKTKEIKRYRGYNSITTSALNALASMKHSFSSLHQYIAFGNGNLQGGYLSSSIVETQLDYNTGIGVKKLKITMMPSQFIGKIISTVGLMSSSTYFSSSNLKDSEGNIISITKTEVDEITIYATVYIKSEVNSHSATGFKDYNYDDSRGFSASILRRLLIGDSTYERYPYIYASSEPLRATVKNASLFSGTSKTGAQTSAGATRTISAEYNSSEANYSIMTIGTPDGMISLLDDPSWTGAYAELDIGVGDGVTTEFDTPLQLLDSTAVGNEVKLDGVISNCNISDYKSDIGATSLIRELTANISDPRRVYEFFYSNPKGVEYPDTLEFKFELVKPLRIKGLSGYGYSVSTGYGYQSAQLYYSTDGVNYVEAPGCSASLTDPNNSTIFGTPSPDAKYFKLICSNRTPSLGYLKDLRIIPDIPQKQLKFNTPPPAGSVITAKLFCKGIPKTNKHILRVSVSTTFADGGVI